MIRTSLRSRIVRALSANRTSARALLAVVLTGVFSSACDVHGITAPGSLQRITVTPNATISALGTVQLTAIGYDGDGRVIPLNPTWTTNAGGTVGTSGLFTAGSVPGTYTNNVVATAGSISGSASVSVVPGALASITLTPTPVTMGVSATQQYTAVGKDVSGNVVAFTPTWSVIASGGSINQSGLFTAGTAAGTYINTVQASSADGIRAFGTVTVTAGPLASVTVTPNPATMAINGTQQFTATGRDASGNTVAITPTWAVVAGGGAINTTGLFTAGTVVGTYTNTVRATSGAFSGTATVIVTAGALTTITVTPNPGSMGINAAQLYTATGADAGGNAVAISPTWSVVTGGGTINSAGLFTAGSVPGTYTNTVRAAVGSVAGTATAIVTPGLLATITVTPNPDTLSINGVRTFTAVGRDLAGNVVAFTPTWAVVNSGGAITSGGVFTAGTVPGAYINTVRATSGTTTGNATVVVTAGALSTITVTPNPDTLATGGNRQFTATGRDASGNVVAISPTWSVASGGGTITSAGLFTAGTLPGTYANTVRAAVGSVAGTATVVVTVGQLATITVTPNPDTLAINGVRTFTAVGRDVSGNVVAFTPTWAVANGGGAITSGGVFTAGTVPGAFINTVRATSGTTSGSATVVVTPGALSTITVTPNPDTLTTGGNRQFTATGRDASGNVVAIVPSWSVVNGGGSILGTGVFTAGGAAGTFANTVRAASGLVSGTATVVVTAPAPAPLIDFGRAAPNGIMAGTAVTCIAGGLISADVSISPGGALSGFPPCVITGVRNLANAAAANAQIDLTAAYNALFARACTGGTVGDIGGTVLAANTYCNASSIQITGNVTLDGGGNPNANFVFQAGTSLITAGNVILINGAQAKNVYFVVGSSATLGTGSQIKGNIVALTSITLVDTANLIGRALARNGAVTLGTSNTITLP